VLILGTHRDGASFQVRGLAGAESLFDQRQVFVAIMHHLSGGGADRQVGFENVTAVQSCSLIEASGLTVS